MRLVFALLLLGVFAAMPARAQEVSECDWRASARALAEPWEANTRTFSNGKTRIALIDTVEPAAGSFYLLILSPPYDVLGDRQCRLVGAAEGIGFRELDFSRLQAQYDPSIGLVFAIPGLIHFPAIDGGSPIWLLVTLNQATGQINAQVQDAE